MSDTKRTLESTWQFISDSAGRVAVLRDDALIGELRPHGAAGSDGWRFVSLFSHDDEEAGTTLVAAKAWVKESKRR